MDSTPFDVLFIYRGIPHRMGKPSKSVAEIFAYIKALLAIEKYFIVYDISLRKDLDIAKWPELNISAVLVFISTFC